VSSKRGTRRSPALTALGLAFVPTAAAATLAAAHTLFTFASSGSSFSGGFAVVAVLHAAGLVRGERAYVFAHEFTHAAAAWLHGAKVFSFVIKADSGHVDLSRMNAFIALAPYWIPLYALLVVGLYRIVSWSVAWPQAQQAFLAAMGAALAFHFCHTARALGSAHQTDLDHLGVALSLSLIALLNALVLLVALKCLFPRAVSLSDSARWVAAVTRGFWGALAGGAADAVRAVTG